MPIVFACAASHAPGIRAWTERAPKAQADKLFSALDELRQAIADTKPDTILLLTSEHWANFFLDHIGAFCIGRAETFEGPIEPWLRVAKTQIRGNPDLAQRILQHCYAHGFELSYAHEMKLDHGSMVPLSFLAPETNASLVPLMFNTLATPRPTPARCLALGRTLVPVLASAPERIAVIATGGLSHDPGERRHGFIDTDFDGDFLANITAGRLERLARYSDADLLKAGAGTLELLAWICLAGLMGEQKPRLLVYEPIEAWATGIGVISYDRAA